MDALGFVSPYLSIDALNIGYYFQQYVAPLPVERCTFFSSSFQFLGSLGTEKNDIAWPSTGYPGLLFLVFRVCCDDVYTFCLLFLLTSSINFLLSVDGLVKQVGFANLGSVALCGVLP